MPEDESPKHIRLSVNITPETDQQIKDMVELKRIHMPGFTATDAIIRSLALASMLDQFIPDGGRIVIRDDDGNVTHLEII